MGKMIVGLLKNMISTRYKTDIFSLLERKPENGLCLCRFLIRSLSFLVFTFFQPAVNRGPAHFVLLGERGD